MNRRLKKELKAAFVSPIPVRKQEFLNSFPYPKADRLDFFITQAGYIRKSFWIFSVLVLAAVFALIGMCDADVTSWGFASAVLPFLSLLAITEIQKSRSFSMTETEMSCKHNFSEVMLIRLCVIGGFYFADLLTICCFAANGTEYGFFRTALYLVTPFLLSSSLSLFLANHLQTRETLYVCGLVTGAVSIFMAIAISGFENIFELGFVGVWSIAAVLAVVLFIIEMKKLLKSTEELV